MKIYTKTGDDGETALFGGGRVSKASARVAAYGEVDELNAWLGAARAWCADAEVRSALERIQGELFVVGAILATPNPARRKASDSSCPPIGSRRSSGRSTPGTPSSRS